MYQALYRKYRPMDFDDVFGQNIIVHTLKNSIKNHTFSHAYMFFGPRGTGKTTLSKIFARNVNCLNPNEGNSCRKCENCLNSFSKECVDIIEIDAASNNGVDEIRELRNKISLVPSQLRYKVYIIDEVHMLSIGAFNALLKTLEEPPEHAIFILATTDPQKVPETIVSRCQTFSFQKISPNVIFDRLKYVCEQEKILIDDDVLQNISIISDGGMRDALGLLDKMSSYCNFGEKITMSLFVELNGVISSSQLSQFLTYIFSSDISSVLNCIHNYDVSGKNLLQIMTQLLNYGRNLVVDYYINHSKLDYSVSLLQKFIIELNEKMFDFKKSDNVNIYVEMFLLKFINEYCLERKESNSNNSNIEQHSFQNITSEIIDKTVIVDNNTQKELSNSMQNHNIINNSADNTKRPIILNLDEIISVRVNNTLAKANKKLLQSELSLFDKLKDFTFDQNFGYIVCALLDSTLRAVSPDNIIISFEYDSTVDQNLSILDQLTEVYNNITNSKKKIAIISDKRWNEVKSEYISNLKNNIKYEIKEEPKVLLEELKNDDIISNSAIELFGDIVEVE